MEEKEAGQKLSDSSQSTKVIKEQKRTDEKNIFEILKRYDWSISLANSKASFLIGVAGAILVGIIAQRENILKITECANFPLLNNLLLLLVGLGMFIALFFALLVAFPITFCGNKDGEYISFIAYSSVARMTFETFQSHHSSENYDFWSDLINQTYIVAHIADKKFNALKIAVCSLLWSLIPFSILFLIMVR